MDSETPFRATAASLRRTIDEALPKLQKISESEAACSSKPGKWSAKQVMGHLIDSASNNHQRFVRAQEVSELVFPGYNQDHWVDCQQYQDRSWSELLTLWYAYNLHLAHIMTTIPVEQRSKPCIIERESDDLVTLDLLATDYVVHLRHHLGELGILKED